MLKLRHNTRVSQSGFTLIEVLLYIGLFSILLVVLTEIFTPILQVQFESTGNAHVVQDGRYLLLRLGHDIHQANAIVSPANLGESGSTLTVNINGEDHIYALNEGTLEMTNDEGTFALTGSETTVSDLSFLRVGDSGNIDTVQIQFTLESTAELNKKEQQHFQVTFGRR